MSDGWKEVRVTPVCFAVVQQSDAAALAPSTTTVAVLVKKMDGRYLQIDWLIIPLPGYDNVTVRLLTSSPPSTVRTTNTTN